MVPAPIAPARQAAAPILSLFRRVLRLHAARLPPPMRTMGDTYAKDEFSRHLRAKTTPEQWRAFVREWQRYCDLLTPRDEHGDPVGAASRAASGTAAAAPSSGSSAHSSAEAAITATPGEVSPEELERMVAASGELPADFEQSMTPDQRQRFERLRDEATRFGHQVFGKKDGTGRDA